MRKIRQHNDIDIVVKLKNDEGAVLDATLIKEYKVFLTQVGYRLRIEDYQILPDGRIGFRFHAANQRIGVYSILVTAVTTDDRVFTTDVCNAFALVRCSCDAEDGSSDAEIEALEVNATFEITAWGGDSGGEVQTSLQYYDDGSGEVVPVKHPDLSTQPSILPYKFAGNYVYEQMFYVTSKQIGESLDTGHIVELGKTEIQNVLVIDSFISGVFMFGDGTFNRTNTVPSSFIIMGTANSIELHVQSLEDAVAIIDEGLESCWIRVVYTTKPKAGGYYYDSESKYNLYINASQDCTFSIAAPDNTFNMVEGKVPDAIVERFITEDHVGLYVHPKYSSQGKKYTIRCSETSEGHSLTVTAALIFIYAHDTYSGVVSLEYWFPQAAERLKKGEKTTLNVDIQYV